MPRDTSAESSKRKKGLKAGTPLWKWNLILQNIINLVQDLATFTGVENSQANF